MAFTSALLAANLQEKKEIQEAKQKYDSIFPEKEAYENYVRQIMQQLPGRGLIFFVYPFVAFLKILLFFMAGEKNSDKMIFYLKALKKVQKACFDFLLQNQDSENYPKIERDLADCIKKFNPEDNIEFISFFKKVLFTFMLSCVFEKKCNAFFTFMCFMH